MSKEISAIAEKWTITVTINYIFVFKFRYDLSKRHWPSFNPEEDQRWRTSEVSLQVRIAIKAEFFILKLAEQYIYKITSWRSTLSCLQATFWILFCFENFKKCLHFLYFCRFPSCLHVINNIICTFFNKFPCSALV